MSSLLVFNRVFRLEILSVMLVFSTPIVYCPPPPPLPSAGTGKISRRHTERDTLLCSLLSTFGSYHQTPLTSAGAGKISRRQRGPVSESSCSPLFSRTLLSVYRNSLTSIGSKKASSHSLVFTKDAHNRDREKGKGTCSISEQ
jgi:hypothetical protein